MVQSLKVILWGEEIGRLAWDARRRLSYFMYNPTFLKKGLNISPLVAPVDGVRGLTPIWGEEAKIYQKLPAFVADSLPDAWGNQLFDLWRQQNHLSNADITPLDKLSFIGKRGMGALEFVPEVSRERRVEKIDIKSLASLAERIFTERENARILPEESITMQSLLTVGTSAGGRQPKAIVAINRKNGEVRSGQISGLEDFDYCLIKFGNSQYCSAELEMTYYKLATMAGINMMPSELYQVDGNNHFMTKRFDRKDGKKVHTQTLAAINPDADSYEQLIAICRKLHLPETDCYEVFRRMVFNVLANNTDDHNKNFSFIMNEDGTWRLAPAYDITYIFDSGGFLPNEDLCMYIRAKLRGITRDDVIQLAKDNGIRRPDAIIRDIVKAIKQFRVVATKYGVAEQWIGRIETTIAEHLKSWGELEAITCSTGEFVINGHTVKNIRMEQAYKGNFHLLAEIDGQERKFVIGKNKEEFSLIESIGIANLSSDQLKEMMEKYFVL
ncbi:MAG TPA: type II toxin-antitoxin system HipA family toxin [Candidatus Parabacteroides faecavium]|nr:type II toxin-antitoxin system HipA family toxin [Candidatus Parabacteroides faecavium]